MRLMIRFKKDDRLWFFYSQRKSHLEDLLEAVSVVNSSDNPVQASQFLTEHQYTLRKSILQDHGHKYQKRAWRVDVWIPDWYKEEK